MVKLRKADLLVYNGLELEIGWLPLLIEGCRNRQVSVGSTGNFNASVAIPEESILEKPRGEVDRTMGDVHPLGNPHYMISPYNALLVTEVITNKLIEMDSENKAGYEIRYDQFKEKLGKHIQKWEQKAASLRGVEVVCYHTHWSYLLDWLGMKVTGYIELRPGIPPTPRHKQKIQNLIFQKNIKLILISSWKDPKKAREIANTCDARLVILPGEVQAMKGTDEYISWIDTIIDLLTHAKPTN
jgi:zinc/manganese transport system substrate-binding protein